MERIEEAAPIWQREVWSDGYVPTAAKSAPARRSGKPEAAAERGPGIRHPAF